MSEEDINQRHLTRMRRKKEVVDQKIGAAKRNAGVLLVNCGNGKGKSSSAFGMAARALGHGMKVQLPIVVAAEYGN
jgi:cob(I)alamin adenosyltransferase